MAGPAPTDIVPPFLARPDGERLLGPYRLIRPLGLGGFAPVWLAEETYDGELLREVAVKLFFVSNHGGAEEAACERDAIVAEARALCRVEHPDVVRFHGLSRDDTWGVVGLVMERVKGSTLEAVLSEKGTLPSDEVVGCGVSVAWALSAVHDAGLVHRDVKPANVMRSGRAHKLIDFGIVAPATPRGGALSRAPLAGTPGFIAPECLHRGAPASAASDLYALGATLHKLATGLLPEPWAGAPPRIDSLVRDPSPAWSELSDVVLSLLSPDPAQRLHHAERAARELSRIREQEQARTSTRVVVSPLSEAPTWKSPDRESPAPETYHDPPLVGRDEETASLARAAGEARRGAVRAVLISSAMGMGRTRLLASAAAQAGFGEERTLLLRCSPERRGPLRPLVRALGAMRSRSAGLDAVRDAVERALAPGVLAPGGESEALEGVEEALLDAGDDAPLLVAADDVQWADAQTITLLRLLLEHAGETRSKLLVVAAVRDEPSPSPHLAGLLGAAAGRLGRGVILLSLSPLSRADTASLATAVLPVSPEVVLAVLRGAGGAPFYVVHALAAWRETGALVFRKGFFEPADDRALRGEVPGVADVLGARMAAYLGRSAELLRAAEKALSAIAIYGGGLKMAPLLRATGTDGGVEEALQTLVQARILAVSEEGFEYGFVQEMVRQAALGRYKTQPWFPKLFRALLDALAEGADAAEHAAFLADGYDRLGATESARRWFARAFEEASLGGRFGEAAELADRWSGLCAEPEAREHARLEAVRALVRGRRFEEAGQRLARIEAPARETEGRARVERRILRHAIARGLREPFTPDAALVGDADALSDPALACSARVAVAGVSKAEEGIRLASEAIARLPAGDLALEFEARVLRAEIHYASDQRDLALAERDLSRALAIAETTSSTWQEVHIEGDLAVIEAEQGRTEAAVRRLEKLALRAEELRMRSQQRLFLQNLAAFLLRAGRASEAEDAARRAADLSASAGDPVVHASALSLRAEALRRTGDLSRALAFASEAAEIQARRDDRSLAMTLLRRAEILEALGRGEEAVNDARAARESAARHGSRDLALGAELWEAFQRARAGAAEPEDLRRAIDLAEASGVALRPFTRDVIARAGAWLAGRTA